LGHQLVALGKGRQNQSLGDDAHRAAGTDPYEENAQFIAHARSDIPWLLEQVAALRAQLAEVRERVEPLRQAVVDMAIPYEAIRADAPSQRWIAPTVWAHIVAATERARALLAAPTTEEARNG